MADEFDDTEFRNLKSQILKHILREIQVIRVGDVFYEYTKDTGTYSKGGGGDKYLKSQTGYVKDTDSFKDAVILPPDQLSDAVKKELERVMLAELSEFGKKSEPEKKG